MNPAYWSAVREHLPDAAIVFDRFHLTKLVNEKLDDLRRALVREATGPMKQTVKGVRYLLLMRPFRRNWTTVRRTSGSHYSASPMPRAAIGHVGQGKLPSHCAHSGKVGKRSRNGCSKTSAWYSTRSGRSGLKRTNCFTPWNRWRNPRGRPFAGASLSTRIGLVVCSPSLALNIAAGSLRGAAARTGFIAPISRTPGRVI